MLCPTCGTWAREASNSAPNHHPNCPHVQAARAFINRRGEETPFLTPHGINKLAYILRPAVADMMADFALSFCEGEPMVRAKFKVVGITPGGDGLKSVTLEPVYTGSAENEQFFKWTPSGRIELGILNPAASEQFEVGKEYYVDFSPAG